MSQRTTGAFALLGGAFLAGSLLANLPIQQGGAPLASAQEAGATAPKGVSISSASSVPGATEPAKVQPPQARDAAEAKILSVLDVLDHYRHGTSNVPREDGRMLRLLAEATGRGTWSRSAPRMAIQASGSAWH